MPHMPWHRWKCLYIFLIHDHDADDIIAINTYLLVGTPLRVSYTYTETLSYECAYLSFIIEYFGVILE